MADRGKVWCRLAWALGLASAVMVVVGLLVVPELAQARPGGGSSFSGGGSSGGGGGGGELELILFLIQLIIEWPEVGIPLTILIIAGYIIKRLFKKRRFQQNWDSAPALASAPVSPDLQRICQLDPAFSGVLFEDFVFRLYAQAHQARFSSEAMDQLAPYVSAQARESLVRRPPIRVPVSNVVIGAMKVVRLTVPARPLDPQGQPNQVGVDLRFESNMTAGAPGQEQTYYVVEDWSLYRAANVTSRPPDAPRDFPCPNCAAPFTSSDKQRCDYCGEVVNTGRFDWLLHHLRLLRNEARPPQITGSVPERGTNLPTISSASLGMRWGELLRDDPAVTDETLGRRLQLIHAELNRAWSALDLRGVRPFVSDGLYDYLQYWINAYQGRGLRNVLEQAQILRWERVKLVRDR